MTCRRPLPPPPGPARRRLAPLGVLLASLLLLPGCSGDARSGTTTPPAAATVTAELARARDVPVVLAAIGSLEPYRSVEIRARVGGELTRVGFAEGDEVRQGQVLFELDRRPFAAALAQAQANLDRDAARLASAKTDVERYADLVAKDFITRQQFDQAQAEEKVLEATLAADRAAVDSARLDLEYCTIRSPLAARAGSLLVQQGNLVKANDVPLVVLNQIRPIHLSFTLPERHLGAIRQRAAAGPVPVVARAVESNAQPHRGELTLIDNTIDRRTGSIHLKATLPNEDRSLWPGDLVLGILYESFIHPLTILSALPFAG